MAWPASTQSLDNAFTVTNNTAIQLKGQAQSLRDNSVSNDTLRVNLISLQRNLDRGITRWNEARVLPGIVEYVRDQFNDPTMDVAAEFNSMVNAAISLRDWIYTNMPTGADGAILERVVNADGTYTDLVFTSAQLQTFRTEADTFITTIG